MPKSKWANPSVIKLIEEENNSDPIQAVIDRTRKLIDKALSQGWNGPPFDPMELAALQQIAVRPNEALMDARISVYDEKPIIEYNPDQTAARANFSICHEIAHTLFTDYSDVVRNRESGSARKQELELEFLCDIAAAEMLLPHNSFKTDASSLPPELKSLLSLTSMYKASLEAVLLRFCDISEFNCAIAVCSFNSSGKLEVDYCKSSKNAPPIFQRGEILDSSSAPYECKSPGWTERGVYKLGPKQVVIECIGLRPNRKTKSPRVGILFHLEPKELLRNTQIEFVYGDATSPRGDGPKIIFQVVNDLGATGGGFGKAMGTTWPQSTRGLKTWVKANNIDNGAERFIELNQDTFLVQTLAQQGISAYGKKAILNYQALEKGLRFLLEKASELGASVHMPTVGAGQANGNWEIIESMIQSILVDEGVPVKVYELPGKKPPKKKMSTLELN